MKIGIDIDGVLTNDDEFILDYATKFCYENNIDFYKDPYLWETRKFNWEEETLQKYRNKYFWEYVNNEPPRKFASEIIKKLKEDGHQIYIITSRYLTTSDTTDGEKMRKCINEWLKKYDIQYDSIYFSNNKLVDIKNLKLDIMIEDSPKYIPNYSKEVHVFCYDCRYNRDLKCDNMTRVFSWYDIYTKICKRHYNK